MAELVEEELLSKPRAVGRPLGDGQGMEDLVARVRPLFASEMSITRWVAIWEALLSLDMACSDEEMAAIDAHYGFATETRFLS